MIAEDLLKKLNNNKEYCYKKEKEEQRRIKKKLVLNKEYQGFAKECLLKGYKIETAWDLIKVEKPYSELIPILIKFLQEKEHSDKFYEGIARALAVYDTSEYFSILVNIYSQINEEFVNTKWAVACAIAASAQTFTHFDVIEQLIYNIKMGTDRNALLSTVKKMPEEQKKRIICFAKNDPQLKKNLKFEKLS